MTAEELTALLEAPNRKTFVGLRDVALIAVMSDTGLRVTETIGIRFKVSVSLAEPFSAVTPPTATPGSGLKP